MKLACVLALFLSLAPVALAQRKPVTLEAVAAAGGRVAGAAGARVIWAADGKRYAYTQGRSLWLYDAPSRKGTELVTLDKLGATALRPPPAAVMEWQNRRVSEDRVQWFPSGKDLLLDVDGDLFVYHLDDGKWDQLTATPYAERDAKLSPDGRRVSFRVEHDLHVLDVSTRKLTRLTDDGSATIGNGETDWVYPEELALGTAHWWSPDSTRIAYLQFDVSRQQLYPHADLLGLRPKAEPQRYPQAGTPNADVRLGVVAAEGGRTRWMDLGETRDALLARVVWMPDGRAVAVQRLNRVQNRLDLLAADVESGAARTLLRESDPYWINVKDDFRFLPARKQFLWSSERDGYRHLYLYSMSGAEAARLTKGEWEVSNVAGVDEAAGQVYFVSTEASPLERHLYRVGFNGGTRTPITRGAGSHTIAMSPSAEFYIDNFSSLIQPARRTLHKSDGAEWAVLREADRRPQEDYEILATEIVTVKAADGATLYARLIKPAGFEAGRKYPAIVMVYGGPHAQSVRNSWAGVSWDQALAHRGYVIWQLDNRGSAGRGHAWEARLFRRFGQQELEDQKAGVAHLVGLGFVDAARIGMYGWSYGGYMTLYSLLNAPDLFRAGIAGAPVTDWRHYDTIYTERYMGLPADNADGYRDSSPVNAAANLKAKLLLVHNFEDDNVLFQHTMRMSDALVRANKQFEMMLYPQKSHGVTGPARRHLLETTTAFFEKWLK